jgi:hypothetical protein
MEINNKRYWCHICNKKVLIIENELRCQLCNKEYIQEINHPEFRRFESINVSGEISNEDILNIVETLRAVEDARIMQLLLESNTQQILDQSFEEDASKLTIKKVSSNFLSQLKETNLSSIESKKECSICHDTFEHDCKAIQLKCLHYYHKACIYNWFSNKNTCPECRVEFEMEECQSSSEDM